MLLVYRAWIVSALWVGLVPWGCAQNNVYDTQSWIQYAQVGRISHKIDWRADVGYRMQDEAYFVGVPLNYFGRAGITYHIQNWSILMGYAYFAKYNPAKDNWRAEHRPYQAVFYRANMGSVNATFRGRTEQRFIENKALNRYELSHRLGLQGLFLVPIFSRTIEYNVPYLTVGDELLFTFKTIDFNNFENRAQIGLGLNVGFLQIHANYMNSWFLYGTDFHILRLQVIHNIDLRSKN